MKREAIILDVDNCWMDSRLWLDELPASTVRNEIVWDKFYKQVYSCRPNQRFIDDIIKVLDDKGYYPLFVTGRSEKLRSATLYQIQNNSTLREPKFSLYMRPNDNYSEECTIKQTIVSGLVIDYDIQWAFDDNIDNIEMYKAYVPYQALYKIETHEYKFFGTR